MARASLSSFERPSEHAAVSDIIRSRSTNPIDVRAALLSGLELASTRTVLDLGCGFGFMADAIAPRVAPGARIIGVDACPANEAPYLARIAATGRRGEFVCRRLERRLEWPDQSFDLVVASYALYFFPEIVPEVARVLAADGLFLAVTHAEASCRDLARVLGLAATESPVLCAEFGFSAENGAGLLAPWFEEVVRVEYVNTLVFDAAHQDELLAYLRFKLQSVPAEHAGQRELDALLAPVPRCLADRGRVTLNKNDTAFRCARPRCR